MDGRGPLDDLSDRPGEQERRSVLRAVGPVHDPAEHCGVHAGQGPDQERGGEGADVACVRGDPLNVLYAKMPAKTIRTMIHH